MNLYQIYKNEQYTLLFRGTMYFLVGVGMLLVMHDLFYFPLLIFIPACSNLYLSVSMNRELRKAYRIWFRELPVSSSTLIGVSTKEGYFFVKTNGWVKYAIHRQQPLSPRKDYAFYRENKDPLPILKRKRVLNMDHSVGKRFILKYASRTALEWRSLENDKILIYKGAEKWILNFNGVNMFAIQTGILPTNLHAIFDAHHTLITMYESYSDELDWLFAFLWHLDQEFYITP
ncbi:hypothetical protein [Rossellomorea marisflavi]|uniref:Uncharacterized protein n=1 Tax=Rossellomorea marisflavi TaxID=189381 RepID=A0A0J5VPC8_9BACI|nr:hypothetical protein [Rossellomorea marisflavi]KMK97447.1 hypothetical protein VL03_01735 [Rossellomorea marisflavi]KMK99194.1 hypothetical protein VL06_21810 [Rossellomorea marisflavi]KML33948.1 hypothetical protein VL12_06705 [Rossellomorea marisflavi]KZE45485.1 hypothetical protein AV649_04645 [Rossellomorea marisflavi]QHA36608.1 hypothetical protein D5E69_12770 [Rossellomorea marisflavi]